MEERILVDGTLERDWADCKVQGCKWKRCASLDSVYCYLHSKDPVSLIMKDLDRKLEEQPVEEMV